MSERYNRQELLVEIGKKGQRKIRKAAVAKERLQSINPEVDVVAHADEITPQTIQGYLEKADVILDGLDNVSTRLLLNDFCVKNKIPWIGGGAIKEKGFVLPFPGGGACYLCVFKNAGDQTGHTDTCDTVGVLGSITHLIGSFQAAECIKMILRHPQQQK